MDIDYGILNKVAKVSQKEIIFKAEGTDAVWLL